MVIKNKMVFLVQCPNKVYKEHFIGIWWQFSYQMETWMFTYALLGCRTSGFSTPSLPLTALRLFTNELGWAESTAFQARGLCWIHRTSFIILHHLMYCNRCPFSPPQSQERIAGGKRSWHEKKGSRKSQYTHQLLQTAWLFHLGRLTDYN